MAETGLKTLMAFFTPDDYPDGTTKVALTGEFAGQVRTMNAKDMIREWKLMSDADKSALRDGIENGSLTY
jgi:hypothetical protein